MTPLLRVDELQTLFTTSRGWLHAVDGVSFTLEGGASLGIVGESGSGKSMLCRSIMRLLPGSAISTGRVEFDGIELETLDAKHARSIWGAEIAIVLQDPSTALSPVVRVGRHIVETLQLHLGMSR